MSAHSDSRFFPPYQQLVTHLRTPLYRNGYFLTLSSLATSGVGLVYWIFAAHRYPAYLIGLNSAVIAAMTFLAGVAEFNLMSALIRFIPIAGRSTKRFVLITYLISLAVSAIISVIFLAYLDRLSPALAFLSDNRLLSIWFILSTMCWCIFVLQDSVLTGLRQTSWVPIENTVFSLTKIALMLIFVFTIPTLGIFASWSFALVVAIIPTNYYIFRKLIPAHEKQTAGLNAQLEPHQIIRFAASDYVGALFWIVCTTLMPVIVTTVSGVTANAYFYPAWTIASTLYLIAPAMGASLVVETAKDQQKLAIYSYKIYKNTMKIILPSAAILTISASYILMIFGKGYSAGGTALLQLLALSAIPSTLNTIFVSVARVQRRTGAVMVVLGSLCALLLGSSYVLLKAYGIVGVGVGWLISQTIIAGIVYMTHLRGLWMLPKSSASASSAKLIPFYQRGALYNLLIKTSTRLDYNQVIIRTHKKWSAHTKLVRVTNILPQIINELPNDVFDASDGNWKVHKVANNETNTTVAFLGPVNGAAPIVVKIPHSLKEADSLRRQSENLGFLQEQEQLGEWRRLLPRIVRNGEAGGQVYFTEYVMPGKPLHHMLRNAELSQEVIDQTVEEIDFLHRKTARATIVDEDLLQSWVHEPIMNLRCLLPKVSNSLTDLTTLDRLEDELCAQLFAHRVEVSWIHGDYAPANILVEPNSRKVTGIVDWDLACANALPLVDLLHLLISIRMEYQQKELGHVVSDLLTIGGWSSDELCLIGTSKSKFPNTLIDLRPQLILTWLRHINANLNKTTRFDHHKKWVNENISSVLKVL